MSAPMNPYARRLVPLIEKWKRTNRRVAIFGIGAHTEYLFAQVPQLDQVNIVAFLESSPTMASYRGHPVHPILWADDHADIVLCSSFVSETRMAALAEPLNCKVIKSHLDSSAEGTGCPNEIAAQGEGESGVVSAWAQFVRSKTEEMAMYRRADAVLVVTENERQLLGTQIPIAKVFVVPDVHQAANSIPGFDERSGIVFLGGFRHAPNVDGARYLLSEVLPWLRRLLPDIRITILGSDPPEEFLDRQSELISVPGYLEDIDTPLSLARVALVPLRFGAGMKGKVYRAMAVGTPNVCTTIGVESMELTDGQDVCIADAPQQLAEAVARLYNDRVLWNRLSTAGLDIVRRQCSPEGTLTALEKALFPDSHWPDEPLGREIASHEYIARADRLREAGAFNSAVEVLEKGIAACGKTALLYLLLGDMQLRAEQADRAILSLTEAENLGGKKPATRRLLAQALYRSARVAEALECLVWLEHGSDAKLSVADNAWIARWNAELGRFEDAEGRWSQVISAAPKDIGAWRWRALTRGRLGLKEASLADYSNAVRLAIQGGDIGLAAALDREMSAVAIGQPQVDPPSIDKDESDYRSRQALCEALGILTKRPGPISRAEAARLAFAWQRTIDRASNDSSGDPAADLGDPSEWRNEKPAMKAIRMDILFVIAPKCELRSPPLSIPSLVAFLRQRGYTCAVHDANLDAHQQRGEKYRNHWDIAKLGFWTGPETVAAYFEDNPRIVYDLIRRVERERPLAVGFTTWHSNFESSIFMAARIKEQCPWVKVVIGGPDILLRFNDKRLEAPSYVIIDAFVVGEGELTLAEVLDRWRAGRNLTGCAGVAFFEGNDLWMAGKRPPIRDLSVIPGPDYSDFDLPRYAARGEMLATTASRGCANSCIYCDEAVFWEVWRTKTGRQIYEEAKELKSRYPQMKHLYFCDSLINGHIRHLREFCELMANEDPGFCWESNAVVRKEMVPEFLALMRRAGCKSLIYGIETVSLSLLEKIGKRLCRNCDIEKVVRDTAAAGIGVWANFMFGLPGETDADALASIEFCVRNKAYLETVVPTFAFCNLSSLSQAFQHPERYGIKKDVHVCYWESEDGTNSFDVRLSRFERFCQVMNREGIRMNHAFADELPDHDRQLGNYYAYIRRYDLAVQHLERAVGRDPSDFITRRRLESYRSLLAVESDVPRSEPTILP